MIGAPEGFGAPTNLPGALRAVAIVILLEGISSAIELVLALSRGHLSVNLGVFYILAAIGLFRLSRGWRTFVLFTLWFAFILIPVGMFLVLGAGGPITFNLFGASVGMIKPPVACFFLFLVFLLCLWQYRVLTRPDIRGLFGLRPR